MHSAYVYYRVAPAQAVLAAARVDALLQAMAEFCTRPPRRLVRCDDGQTWMEIYEGIADWRAFEGALRTRQEALQMSAVIDGTRHLECFVSPAMA